MTGKEQIKAIADRLFNEATVPEEMLFAANILGVIIASNTGDSKRLALTMKALFIQLSDESRNAIKASEN